jgi:hypothetical protein
MDRTLRLVAMTTLFAAATPALAQTPVAPFAPPPAPPAAEWRSMSSAKVAVPLPASSPMAPDLAVKDPPAKWADVPLPPPPAGAKPAAAAGAAPAAVATGAAVAVASADTSPAKETEPTSEPKVKTAFDQTGAMVSITQDLDSDRHRKDWAASGGQLPGYEANAGMTILYKDLSQTAGAGAYMSGVGFNFGGRLVMYILDPPRYETRDRNWSAWKVGGGADIGMLATTIYTPPVFVLGRQVGGGTMSASMTTMTLVGTFGYMKAFGSFDSPTAWSGFAVGFDWAPSYQSTSTTVQGSSQVQTSSSFNAKGFAINFESGSMQSIAARMSKKARVKLSLFFLPPAGDIPFMMTASVAGVWY